MKRLIIGLMAVMLLAGCGKQMSEKEEKTTEQKTTERETLDKTVDARTEETNAEQTNTSVDGGEDVIVPDENLDSIPVTEEKVYTTICLKIRQAPSMKAGTEALIGPGDSLTRIKTGKNWSQIRYNGKECYAASQFLTTEKPENACPISHNEPIQPPSKEQVAAISALDPTPQGYGVGSDVNEHNRPNLQIGYEQAYAEKYKVTFIGQEEQRIFLTFDMGWEHSENGVRNTEVLLNMLQEKNVKAAFFMTHEYANNYSSDLVERMIREGHVVGNHGYYHPEKGIPSQSLEKQIEDTMMMQNYVKETFGYDMFMYRFSSSIFSKLSLGLMDAMGYHTSFWSVEAVDWDPSAQPDPAKTLQEYMKKLHPGAVYMLHATSTTNINILSQFIDAARAVGYEFGYYCR